MDPAPRMTINVLAYAPTVFYHCQHCELTFREMGIGERVHREHASASLPDDLLEEFHALSDWIHRVYERHGDRVRIKVIDVASIEGCIKSIKHRARHFPTVIIDGEKHVRPDLALLDEDIDRSLANAPVNDGFRKEVTPSHTS
jgi:hypothetical protein